MKKVKILTIILIIVLISMAGFAGIYVQEQNRMEDKIKDYTFLSNIKGTRNIRLQLNTEKEEIIKDAEGNIVETEEELTDEQIAEKGYKKESVPSNNQDVLNVENYKKTKEVIEKRLDKLAVPEYEVALDEKNGDIVVKLPETQGTDEIISNINTVGKFEISDAKTRRNITK